MPLYLDYEHTGQIRRNVKAPLLLSSPHFTVQYHAFQKEETGEVWLEDAFEVSNVSSQTEPYILLPAGCMSLIFYITGSSFCDGILCGPHTQMKTIELPANATFFCARFCMGSTLEINCSREFVNHSLLLSKVFLYAKSYLARIRAVGSFMARCRIVLKLLANNQRFFNRPSCALTQTIERIHAENGNCRISNLACECGVSGRRLSQMFREQIGFSVKTYCELIRFQTSFYYIVTTRPKVLSKVADQCGYYDLPHMNRAYRKFGGDTVDSIRCGDMRTLSVHATDLLSGVMADSATNSSIVTTGGGASW